MKKIIFVIIFLLTFINATNANIYWVYEFYKISPQSNIFIIGDSDYQECLKSQLSEKEYKLLVPKLYSCTSDFIITLNSGW